MLAFNYQLPKTKYRIISFDGGGIRGVLAATLLHRLTKQCPSLIKNTDLFVGTSAGSFIALGLANGLTPYDIKNLFSLENTKKMFAKRRPYYLIRPKYSNRPLKNLLKEVFPYSLRLTDLQKRVVIASFKLFCEKSREWEPVFFNNFPSSDNKLEKVVDVALSSSAAPVYFPSYYKHIDGGVIANNPDTAAISYAVGKNGAHQKLENVVHLSLGTGWNPMKISRDTTNWGIAQWAYSLFPGPTNPKLPLLTILTEGDVESDTFISQQLLNDRYFRLNPRLPEKILLDDYKKVPELIRLANHTDLTKATEFVLKHW